MNTYRLTFTINGTRTTEIVSAHTLGDAKRIIRERYAGCNINFISTGHEYM